MRADTIVVVGASIAGLRAAEALRAGGHEGRLVIVGAERHFPPIDRPPLSKQLLSGGYSVERARLKQSVELGAGTELLLGEVATGVDLPRRDVVLASGRRVPFDRLLVATGSRARRLPGQPDLGGVLTLRTFEDSQVLRGHLRPGSRLVVVGAGFVGTEVAATAVGLGAEVTVVDEGLFPLQRSCGRVVGEFVRDLHRRHGVDFRMGSRVQGFDGEAHVEGVRLTDGTVMPADVVVVGIGSVPNTEWLIGSGLPLHDGLVCGADLLVAQTPCVAGAGDIVRWHNRMFERSMRVEHWTNAVEQGAHAAASLLGRRAGYSAVPYVWSDQYDLKIQLLGITSDDFVELERAGDILCGAYVENGHVVGGVCVNRPAMMGKLRRLIAERGAADGLAMMAGLPRRPAATFPAE